VVFDVVGQDDIGQGRGVESEKHRTQHRPLRDPAGKSNWVRGEAVDDDCLLAVGKVGKEPGESGVSDAESVLEAVEEDRVIDSVKGSREIEESEKRDVARVSGQKKVVEDVQ